MKKRGQIALEFLTTYGWAFLVILIMIGALSYFGILKPSMLLPDRCTFGTYIECRDFLIDSGTGDLKIKLKNNIGESIFISSWNVESETGSGSICLIWPTSIPFKDLEENLSPPPDIIWGPWKTGEVIDFTFSGCDFESAGLVSKEKGKVYISLTYYTARSGPGYPHDIQGEIYGSVR